MLRPYHHPQHTLTRFFPDFLQKCIAECFERFSIISGYITEPLSDFLYKKISYLFIWNNQTIAALFGAPLLCQIASGKKHTPEVFNFIIQLIVSEFLGNFLFDALS